MNKCLQLAGIKMSPYLLLRVVMHGRLLPAYRTQEPGPRHFFNPHVNAIERHIYLNLRDPPRQLYAEQHRIELYILHAIPPVTGMAHHITVAQPLHLVVNHTRSGRTSSRFRL
jgi:hypothetical protein